MLSKFSCYNGGGPVKVPSIWQKLLIPLAFFQISRQANAQETFGKTDLWFFLNVEAKLNEHFGVHNELHLRYDDGLHSKQQFLWRPSISFKINGSANLAGGFTYIKTYPYGEFPLMNVKPEVNLWEQFTLNHNLLGLKISHRYRLEHRFQSSLNLDGEYDFKHAKYGNRFRYRTSLKHSIGQKNYLHFFNEIWITSADMKEASFDRNWLYLGLGRQINKGLKVEFAYLYQNIRKTDLLYERHPTFQLTWIYKFGKND